MLVLGTTILLSAALGALYVLRASGSLRAQFFELAKRSAQIFAEAVDAGTAAPQEIAQIFVRGDVLYAQVVRNGQIIAEDPPEASSELGLPEVEFSGTLLWREGQLRDGTPYLELLRPLTGASQREATPEPSYVRVGFSLLRVRSALQAEILLVLGVGLGILLIVGLLCGMYLFFRARSASAPGDSKRPAAALVIDPAGKEVRLRGKRVNLSPKEYELVSLLASEPGRVFSDREILERVWPQSHTATSKDVKQYIYLLRKKLEPDAQRPRLIVTHKGFGYKLVFHEDD